MTERQPRSRWRSGRELTLSTRSSATSPTVFRGGPTVRGSAGARWAGLTMSRVCWSYHIARARALSSWNYRVRSTSPSLPRAAPLEGLADAGAGHAVGRLFLGRKLESLKHLRAVWPYVSIRVRETHAFDPYGQQMAGRVAVEEVVGVGTPVVTLPAVSVKPGDGVRVLGQAYRNRRSLGSGMASSLSIPAPSTAPCI